MSIVATPVLRQSLLRFQDIFSMKMVCEFESDEVNVTFWGTFSDKTYIVDVSKHFKSPIQRKENNKSWVFMFIFSIIDTLIVCILYLFKLEISYTQNISWYFLSTFRKYTEYKSLKRHNFLLYIGSALIYFPFHYT